MLSYRQPSHLPAIHLPTASASLRLFFFSSFGSLATWHWTSLPHCVAHPMNHFHACSGWEEDEKIAVVKNILPVKDDNVAGGEAQRTTNSNKGTASWWSYSIGAKNVPRPNMRKEGLLAVFPVIVIIFYVCQSKNANIFERRQRRHRRWWRETRGRNWIYIIYYIGIYTRIYVCMYVCWLLGWLFPLPRLFLRSHILHHWQFAIHCCRQCFVILGTHFQ